ncbi:hypothetical protein M0805_006858 [Coniferiporia weirii]|nr:hypothetical protein M0805_006858 [Coniferiporia weirii]
MVPEKISLFISNQRAYVWEVKDIAALRSQHRICGLLGGTLPHLAQQNVFLGVPLVLMPEEVALLVEKGFASIVDDVGAHHEPTQAEKEEWIRAWKLEQKQSVAQKEDVKGGVAARKAVTEEATLKRRQREERRAAALAKIAAANEGGVDELQFSSMSMPAETTRPSTPASVLAPSTSHIVKIPTASNSLSWHHPSEHAFHTLAAAREAGVWSYPSTPEERARCGVFRALWEKGYYMGCGIKFGGEFLVYPGDPLRYHSHFVASVLESSSAALRPMEIVAHGRLGTATKKAHLLCAWNEETQEADIFSIEWAGFG